jgi:alpha-glucosidase
MAREYLWWERGTIYQVYPRSFYDVNSDGVGDLRGIQAKLDYLSWLGVDAVWLSPIYPSPMADFGYDISDYVNVDPIFGTLSEFDALIDDVHRRGMKLVLDFVPNHTSDQHAWFRESRQSRHSPKRDWYLWRDPPVGGGPPNNWLAQFGGSAWEFDEATGQYYYHAFLKEQPDLNWRNPEVQEAMLDVLRFWLDRGVDGFRVDVIWHIVKDEQFRDNPPNETWQPTDSPHNQVLATYTTDRPEVHDIIGKMRAVLDSYPERMMVGEIYLPVERLVTYYGASGSGAHLPFNFQLLTLPWNAHVLREAIENYEAALPEFGWPNWVLGNHDNHRIASRIGLAQARVAGMLLLTLRGTPTMYYGDELGMYDVPIPPAMVHDPYEKNVPGLGLGRDPERTPMQWSPEPSAGFSNSAPWLPVAEDYAARNVQVQSADPHSMLSLYRRLLVLRKAEPALAVGSFRSLPATGDVLAYRRAAGDKQIVVVLNLGSRPATYDLGPASSTGAIALSTQLDREGERVAGRLDLRPDEGVIIALA